MKGKCREGMEEKVVDINNIEEKDLELEKRIEYLEENVIKDDIDNRGIRTGIPTMTKKDYIWTGIFAVVCLILVIIGGWV